MALTQVTSAGLKDGEILNADINASAAITGTKVTPNFGSQNVVTTGTLGSSNLTITNTAPWIQFTDTDTNPDWLLQNSNGAFVFHDGTTTRLQLNNDGHVDVTGNLDVGAGVDVTGSISVSGTVDGVDIAARNTLFGGLTSSSGVLTNGVTATTQSASDNSTKVATTAYTDTAVSNLVDSAPGALNTLNELAAALGDDANFSTTVTNSIATKLPLAGGTLTGNVLHNDNVIALFGTGSDLRISHNGTDSHIINTTGTLHLYATSIDPGVRLIPDGAVEIYYDGSKKFETLSNGVRVTGQVDVNGGGISLEDTRQLILGDGDDLKIYHGGPSDPQNYIDGRTNSLYIRNNTAADVGGNIYIQALSGENSIICHDDGAVELYYDNSKKFETTSTGATITGSLDFPDGYEARFGTGNDLKISHDGTDSRIANTTGNLIISDTNGLISLQAKVGEESIKCAADGTVEVYYDGAKKWETASYGTLMAAGTRADFHGNIKLYDNSIIYIGNSNDLQIYHDGGGSKIVHANVGDLQINNSSGDTWIASNGVVRISNNSHNGYMAKFDEDGAVELYYNGSKTVETGVNQLTLYGNSSECNLEFKTSDNTRRAFIGSTNGNNITFYNAASEKIWHYANNAQIELYYDNALKYQTRSDGGLVTGTLYFNDTNTSVSEGSGNGVKIASNYGHMEIGPQNSSWCHINTDRAAFYFNKNVSVDGDVYPYGNNQHSSGTSGSRWSNVYSQDLNVIKASGNLSAVIQADSGLGTMEIAGSSGAFIDFKSPTSDDYDLRIGTSGSGGYFTVPSGHIECSASFIPNANNSRDLGSSSLRWRDLYIMDLQLSNKGGANEVDGTWGDWTLQEGETDVFMINNRTGKRYKMALQEVS